MISFFGHFIPTILIVATLKVFADDEKVIRSTVKTIFFLISYGARPIK